MSDGTGFFLGRWLFVAHASILCLKWLLHQSCFSCSSLNLWTISLDRLHGHTVGGGASLTADQGHSTAL